MNAGKGVLGVTVIETVILMCIAGWIEMFVGTRFSFHSEPWTIRIACVALYFANYYVLVSRGHGITFEREFTHLEKSRKVLLLASCGIMVLATIAVMIYSVSAYHRFFHIIPKSGF